MQTRLRLLWVLYTFLTNCGVSAQVGMTAPWLLSFASSSLGNEGGWYHPTRQLLVKLNEISTTCPHARAEWVVVLDPKPMFLPRSPTARPQGKLMALTLTYNAKARARSKSRGMENDRTRIVAVFGEHGRERITSELALSIVQRYCGTGSMAHALHNLEIVLVPIVNVAGRHEAETNNDCSRLNANGVDVNRNYVVQWGFKDADTLSEEETEGSHPLSEWETRAIDAIIRRTKPHAYLSFHSGDRSILLPWDSGARVSSRMELIAKRIRNIHCRDCRIGTASQLFGYRAYGTGVDHATGMYGVPFACTLEIYGFEQRDCNSMFNPMDRTTFTSVMTNWSGVMETVGLEAGKLQHNSQWSGTMRPWRLFGGARWSRYRILFLTESGGNEETFQYEPPMFFMLFIAACFSVVGFSMRRTTRQFAKGPFPAIRRRCMRPWCLRV
ncbi:Zinc carboxypeptidase [Gracilaria domingensis]|nr:Zinc carboxypeptidase [Gracilaria domingensis]